jgi:hypothetical protein
VQNASNLGNGTYYVGVYDNVYGTSSVTTRGISCAEPPAPTPNPTPAPTPNPTPEPTPAPVNCQSYFLTNTEEYSENFSYTACDGTFVESSMGPGSQTICAREGTVYAGGAIIVDGPLGSCS